ncbi:MAG: hypothetical protein NZ951_04500 [Dehalococcoidia bacterium]|nr:hypothetical protein [Dehalococcoidia bacterium]MDW8120356.1 hypothetical protein [Chloroflexota bacterium]
MGAFSPSRVGGWCAVAGSALLLISVPLLVALRPDGLPPLHTPLPDAMRTLQGHLLPFWIGEHLVLTAFFFLLGVAVWGATHPLRERNRPLGWLALLAGGIAMLATALAFLWHAVLDPIFASLYATHDPAARAYLVQMATQVDKVRSTLLLLGYLSIPWAFLFTVVHTAHRTAPLWWAWLSWTVVIAVALFPPVALAWSLPAGPIVLGKGVSLAAGDERSPSSRRRLRARASP